MSTMPFFQPPLDPLPTDLSARGQTVIVTGASSGLGQEFCRQFLTRHVSTLVLAVRNIPKGEQAKAAILADPEVQKLKIRPDVRVMRFDAASYKNIHDFATQVKQEFNQLHILMLNAGANGLNFRRTEDGHEETVQVNHLANALLYFELLPLLERTASSTGKPTRVSVTGSRMYDTGTLLKEPASTPPDHLLEFLDDKKNFKGFPRYGDTKLLILLLIHRLGKLYKSDKVIVNIFCPGLVDTPMTKDLPWFLRIAVAILGKVKGARKVEHGGWTGLNAALLVGPESHGQLIGDTTIEKIDDFYQSDNIKLLEDQVWQDTMGEVGKFSMVPEWAKGN
ncbi:hypothetical protein FSARC_11328 [Fusarium sarcochroum]|uniref:Short-chain dehydrogenase/reductase n=1 Tax=Fusarium sarcochroum TaxID=1208366 RepID=A0A8H4TGA4_9HYPO|nr:hypothetical protein FSARC_11328 [Fusarium sarcochroum]